MRESEKNKLLKITKETIEKAFELKWKESQEPAKAINRVEIFSKLTDFIGEPYILILKELIFKSEEEQNEILDKEFPKNKQFVLDLLNRTKKTLATEHNLKDLGELKRE